MPSGNESLVHAIRARMDVEAFFREETAEAGGLRGRGRERMAFCPFHENRDTPALSVNVEEGLYCCRNPACGASGDVFSFFQRKHSMTFPEAVRTLAQRYGILTDEGRRVPTPPTLELAARHSALLATFNPMGLLGLSASGGGPTGSMRGDTEPLDEAIVTGTHERLLASPAQMAWLAERRGLTRETVERWTLGHDGQRYYIPIRDGEGRVVNIRRYLPGAQAADKMLSWRPGFGGARLWPEEAFEPGMPVHLFEGEMDALLARQLGLNAATATGGSGTWRDAWNERFRDRHVYICYDVDAAGQTGARRVANALAPIAASVKVVRLPITEPAGADITDYIVGHGHTLEEYLSLAAATPPFVRELDAPAEGIAPGEAVPAPRRMHLAQAALAEYNDGDPVQVAAMVSGKHVAPFLVPAEVRLYGCGLPALPMCDGCPVNGVQDGAHIPQGVEAPRQGEIVWRAGSTTNKLIQFVGKNDREKTSLIKGSAGVPTRCTLVKIHVRQTVNLEAVQLIPEIDRSEGEAQYVTREAYFVVGDDRQFLQPNRSYVLTGITTPDPSTQQVTHLFTEKVPSQSTIDRFSLTPEVAAQLRHFQPERPGAAGLAAKLDEVYSDLERVTRIYERRDLMLGVDLTFHSVLGFTFLGERLARGWTECLIVGDSRTGKTTIVARLMEHYGAGEMTSGENTSIAGLLGGLNQMGSNWALRWGKIPLNDRRLLAIDEASNLPTDHIGRLSSMRSSGVAEVTKIHTERTHARTRAIWISNPRSTRTMREYSQGVLAVKELIGEPSDIARFDVILTASSQDVHLATINAERRQEAPARFDAGLCHQRVMWAWSRRPGQILWADGAERLILARAMAQGEKYRYATDIPLVEPNEQRVKLARLAVAAAAMFYSTDLEGEALIVRPEHVDFVYHYLEDLYNRDGLAYASYAETGARRNHVTDEDRVRQIIHRQPNAARQLMENEVFQQTDLMDVLGVNERTDLRAILQVLLDAGFLKRTNGGRYVKTSGAIRWLRDATHPQTTLAPQGAALNGNGTHGGNGAHPVPVLPEVPEW